MGRLLGVSYVYISVALLAYVFFIPMFGLSEIQQFRLIIGMAALNFALVSVMSYILIDLKNPNPDLKPGVNIPGLLTRNSESSYTPDFTPIKGEHDEKHSN